MGLHSNMPKVKILNAQVGNKLKLVTCWLKIFLCDMRQCQLLDTEVWGDIAAYIFFHILPVDYFFYKTGWISLLISWRQRQQAPWNVSNYLPIGMVSHHKRLDLYEHSCQNIRSLIITNWSNLHCTVTIYREIHTLWKWSMYKDICNSQICKDMYNQVAKHTVWLSLGWWVLSLDQAFEPVH